MENVDVITEILDVLMIIVKELVEALPQCVNIPEGLELIQYVREDFTTIFSFLPTVLHTEYLNPILAISDLLTVLSFFIDVLLIENCCSNAKRSCVRRKE